MKKINQNIHITNRKILQHQVFVFAQNLNRKTLSWKKIITTFASQAPRIFKLPVFGFWYGKYENSESENLRNGLQVFPRFASARFRILVLWKLKNSELDKLGKVSPRGYRVLQERQIFNFAIF